MRQSNFAVCFDIGGTLTINSIGLNWSATYNSALTQAFNLTNIKGPHQKFIEIGKAVLTKYNTRVNPRLFEVSAKQIFDEILTNCGLSTSFADTLNQHFFEYYFTEQSFYDDVTSCLTYLRNSNYPIAYLSDVAYGQSYNEIFFGTVVNYLKQYSDILLTSVDVGFRKPSKEGFTMMSNLIGYELSKMIYIGDEEKDVIGSNNCGMISILIDRTGSGMIFGQKYTINSLNALPDILANLKV